MSKLTGAVHQLTGVNVRNVGNAIKQELQNVQWKAAWAEKKEKYMTTDGIQEDSIPTICADLANYKLDERAGKVMEGVQHYMGRAYAVASKAAVPYAASIAQGATAVFHGATEGALKLAEGAKGVFSRGKEYAQAAANAARRTLKRNQKPVINDFEMFALHHLGFYKASDGNYHHKVFPGIIKHQFVYRALQNLYADEQHLLLLQEFYNKKNDYDKRYQTYLTKKKEYETRVSKYKNAMDKYAKEEEEKEAKVEENYQKELAEYKKDMEEYGKKLEKYKQCRENPLKLKVLCDSIKPSKIPIEPTRKQYVRGKAPSLPKSLSVKSPTPLVRNRLPTRNFTPYLQEAEAESGSGSKGGRRTRRRR